MLSLIVRPLSSVIFLGVFYDTDAVIYISVENIPNSNDLIIF